MRIIISRIKEIAKQEGLICLWYKSINKLGRLSCDIKYEMWLKKNRLDINEIEEQSKEFKYMPTISVVVPAYNTPHDFLCEMIESIQAQTYRKWELCIADASDNMEVKSIVEYFQQKEERIRYKKLKSNRGISDNTNEAVDMTEGEYIALVDHDDILTSNALYEVVNAINNYSLPDVLYTDEDKIDARSKMIFDINRKPDFSIEMLRSCNYINHLTVFKKSLFKQVGGFRKDFDGSQDYDLILRLTESANKVIHIPKVLYHWRMHINSVALNPESKLYAYEAGKKAIESHLERNSILAKVEFGRYLGMYKVIYKMQQMPLVTIIIRCEGNKEKIKKFLKHIKDKTTYKNYEIFVGQSQENICKSNGDYIILLDEKIEILSENWIEELLIHAVREKVGAVGGKTYFKNKKIYDAGLYIKDNYHIGYCHRGIHKSIAGYFGRDSIVQNLSCVNTKCIMIKKSLVEEVKCFIEIKSSELRGIKMSFLLQDKGYSIVYTPYAEFSCNEKYCKKAYIEVEERIQHIEVYYREKNLVGEN